MAVRIYSLAKELKLDSKELVDLCTQIGISGKGSALASLTDDEEVKVRDYLKGSGTKGPAKGGPSGGVIAPERPAQPARPGRMPVISTPRPASPLAGLRRAGREEETAPVEEPAGPAATGPATIAPATTAS
ncbi:MAG TPA: translation initiation factor IF-2 N-terminal domain-containing protein, partial [Lacipirellulaceae bacterium]|nr:translation initiation factor IF-2 N-terminal domain-containing protein [Lacipirellulaceae bacterium]